MRPVHTPRRSAGQPGAAQPVPSRDGDSGLRKSRISELAASLEGVAYRRGGTDIDGFDCSGFVAYVYSCFGIELPRRAEEQADLQKRIGLENAAPGDILVFKLESGWHSAIFTGNGFFINAPKAGGRVRRDRLTPYWLAHLRYVVAIF